MLVKLTERVFYKIYLFDNNMNYLLVICILLVGLNFSHLAFNEELIMCICLIIFYNFLFYVFKQKVNMFCYTDLKEIYKKFVLMFAITIKSIDLFLDMYLELFRIIKGSYVSEYLLTILIGVKKNFKIDSFKFKFVTILFTNYWINTLYMFKNLTDSKIKNVRVSREFRSILSYEKALLNNNNFIC